MKIGEIHSCPELMDLIQEVGFLPLLDSGIRGYSADFHQKSAFFSKKNVKKVVTLQPFRDFFVS